MKVVTTEGFIWIFGLLYRSGKPTVERGEVMAAWRRAIELPHGDEETAKLRSIAQSRTEPASRVERARILLAYREDPSFFAVGRSLGLHHQTVHRCVERDHARSQGLAGVDGLSEGEGPGRRPDFSSLLPRQVSIRGRTPSARLAVSPRI